MKARAKAGRYDYTTSCQSQVDHWLGGGHFFILKRTSWCGMIVVGSGIG